MRELTKTDGESSFLWAAALFYYTVLFGAFVIGLYGLVTLVQLSTEALTRSVTSPGLPF